MLLLTDSFKEYPWICIKRPSCCSSRVELDLPAQWGQPAVWCELNPVHCLWRRRPGVLSERWALLCLGMEMSLQAALYRYILMKLAQKCCAVIKMWELFHRGGFYIHRAISLGKELQPTEANPNRGHHAWNCDPLVLSSHGFSDFKAFQWTMGDRFVSHLKSSCSLWDCSQKKSQISKQPATYAHTKTNAETHGWQRQLDLQLNYFPNSRN